MHGGEQAGEEHVHQLRFAAVLDAERFAHEAAAAVAADKVLARQISPLPVVTVTPSSSCAKECDRTAELQPDVFAGGGTLEQKPLHIHLVGPMRRLDHLIGRGRGGALRQPLGARGRAAAENLEGVEAGEEGDVERDGRRECRVPARRRRCRAGGKFPWCGRCWCCPWDASGSSARSRTARCRCRTCRGAAPATAPPVRRRPR